MGRATSLVVVIGGLVLAYSFTDIVSGLKVWLKVGPMMGIAFWLGLLWRRTSVAGAWASTLTGFATWWLVTRPAFVEWASTQSIAEPLRLVVESKGKAAIYDPWQITLYLSAGVVAGVIVSLLTPGPDKERLDRFYALTRTPIQPGEELLKPCNLPSGVQPYERPMLVTAFGLEVPRPSATSLVGFIAGWLCVGALIGGFVWMINS